MVFQNRIEDNWSDSDSEEEIVVYNEAVNNVEIDRVWFESLFQMMTDMMAHLMIGIENNKF
tara:strand:- start:108 stop:290 length:183 start_codon:yes stop_codon:yes gene_type:complete